METTIILLHGAGGHPWTMLPIKYLLNYKGYYNVHNIAYDFSGNLESCIESANNEILKVTNKSTDIIVIGQSLGGVIGQNLHKNGWKVQKLIAIVSPLKGARVINQIEEYMNPTVADYVRPIVKRPVYNCLADMCDKSYVPPPHPVHTISASWGNTEFDGCVYTDEAMINPDNHYHINWSDHRTVFFSPRLMIHLSTMF